MKIRVGALVILGVCVLGTPNARAAVDSPGLGSGIDLAQSTRAPQQRSPARQSISRPRLAPTSSLNRSQRNSRHFQPRSQRTNRPPTQSGRVSRSQHHQRQTRPNQNQVRPSVPRSSRSRPELTKQRSLQPPRPSLSCDDPQNQQDLNRCAFQTLTQANHRLSLTYRKLLPNLSETRQQLLRQSQVAWAAYRDRECRFYDSSAEGGSLQPLLNSGCKTRLTRDRTQLLSQYLSGKASPTVPEGDRIPESQRQQRYRQVQERLSSFENNEYRELRSRLLRNAEQAWRQYRNQACGFEASGGGNAANAACRQWQTNQRYIQLGQHLDFR